MPGCPTKPSVPPLSRTRRPGEGFYTYVNQNWLKKKHISLWRSEYGVSDEIEEQTNKELTEILSRLKHNPDRSLVPKSSEDHLRILSHIWNNRTVESEETYLKICLNQLTAATSVRDYSRFFGWLCKSRVSTLLELVDQEEIESPYYVRASLTPGHLTLPKKYYFDRSSDFNPVTTAYIEFVTTCSVELGLPYLIHGIKAEADLAKIMDAPFDALMKRIQGSKLHGWAPDFDFDGFMEGLDVDPLWHERLWLLDAPDRVKRILKWICTADNQAVSAVFALHLITFAAPYLRPAIRNAANKLFDKALRGVDRDPPPQEQFLSDIKAILPDALCNVYAKKQHDEGKIEDIKKLVDNLRDAAINVMDETAVLSKRTKARTKEKISRMRFEVGKGNPAPLPSIIYYPDSLVHSMISVLQGRSNLIRRTTGKPSGRTESSYACFVANASYFSESNNIVMPWGILQWPFYCRSAPVGWNYGGIGATISHEMTHAFDLEGSMYSPRAVYKEWWTRKNRERFQKKTRKVATFFSKFKHYGVPLDGKKTVSENWADLGGIVIALRGLKSLLDSMSATDEVRRQAHRNFFIAYAVSWRTLVRKEKMIYAIKTSVHAPGEDRTDRIVAQFQEWYDAFDIKETDPLFVPVRERLKFF